MHFIVQLQPQLIVNGQIQGVDFIHGVILTQLGGIVFLKRALLGALDSLMTLKKHYFSNVIDNSIFIYFQYLLLNN